MSYIVVNEKDDARGKVMESVTYGPYRSLEAADKAVLTMMLPGHRVWVEKLTSPEEYNLPGRRKPLTEEDE